MRNDFTDMIGNNVTELFHRLNMPIKEFIDHLIDKIGAFDITNNSFHVIECNCVVSVYYNTNRNRWYAKF